MKILKLFISLLMFVACQNSSSKAQEPNLTLVGKYDESGIVLTIDKQKTLQIYNANLLKLSGIEANFKDIYIKETVEKEFVLVFKGEIYTSTFLVTANNSNLYATNTISCTTSECASESFGCTPKNNGVACWPCNNKGKCTKTVSSVSMID